MMSLSPAEQLLYCTIRLVSSKFGKPLSTGTGFFYQFQLDDDRICPCLITNKHVIKDADEVSALCHNEDVKNPGNPTHTTAAMRFIVASSKIFYHPSADVDLCAIPLAQIMTQARDAGRPLFLVILDKSLIPRDDEWEDFDAIEEITMIGCPNGLFDEINSLPLIRRGITASTLTKDFNGKNEFMVDMACFPGSSGSPVFIFDKMGFFNKKNNTTMMGGTRLKLVGVLYAGPLITNAGTITFGTSPSVQVASMMHLGYAIRSTEVERLGDIIRSSLKA